MADTRIYTDDRFPGLEVINEGTQFRVCTPKEGAVDQFQGQERCGSAEVSEAFAERRARLYFDRLMVSELRQIDEDLEDRDELGLPRDRDASFVNSDLPPPPMEVLTPDMVLDMWERAQAMPEGPQKQALLRQVQSASAQLESAAEEVVDRILRG